MAESLQVSSGMADGLQVSSDISSSSEQTANGLTCTFSTQSISAEDLSTDTESSGEECISKEQSPVGEQQEPSRIKIKLCEFDLLMCEMCHQQVHQPKILPCLHSLCLGCILKLIQDEGTFDKFLCPSCQEKVTVPENGAKDLPDNIFIANLAEMANCGKDGKYYCVICKMRDEEKIATGKCMDCGDILCADCLDKHTFSRMTLNHKIVSLEDLSSDERRHIRPTLEVTCPGHPGEVLKYFCQDCQVVVCRDCVLLSHKTHKCITCEEALGSRMEKIKQTLEALEHKVTDLHSDDLDLRLQKLAEAEEKVTHDVEEAVNELTTSIANAKDEVMSKMKKEFERQRTLCETRRHQVEKFTESSQLVSEMTRKLLDEGKAAEVFSLESAIRKRVQELQKRQIHPDSPNLYTLPEVEVASLCHEGKLKLFKSIPVRIACPINKEGRGRKSKSGSKASDEQSKQSGTGSKAASMPQPAKASSRSTLPIPGMTQISHGIPALLAQGQMTMMSQVPLKPVQNLMSIARTGNAPIGPVSLKLKSKIDTKLPDDEHQPVLEGIACADGDTIVVTDRANKKVKLFTQRGQFVQAFPDPTPYSVAACGEIIAWNSECRYVYIKSHIQNVRKKMDFAADGFRHPVASMQGSCFLVGNLRKGRRAIGIYNIQGAWTGDVYPNFPDDQEQDIRFLTANSRGQIILSDRGRKVLAIIDINGNPLAEFVRQSKKKGKAWIPGGVSTDECDHIFVMDQENERLLRLTPDGKYLQDWALAEAIVKPLCLACDRAGHLLVTGGDHNIYMYDYKAK